MRRKNLRSISTIQTLKKMKVTLRGEITHVGEPRTAGASEVKEVIIHRKYHDPDTGELKGEDYFPVQVWKDKWNELNSSMGKGNKVEMQGFVNGRRTEKNGEPSYFCNIVARSFKNV